MDAAFFLIAAIGPFLAMYRSLGCGFLAVITVGYFSGVIRANFLGVFTTFMFDAALLGFYVGFLTRKSQWVKGVDSAIATSLVLFLIAWPMLLCLIPVNHFLVRCVGLRAAIWFLPVVLIATRLTASDLTGLTRGLVVLNLIALAVGIYIYVYGVQALYPVNTITQIIYKSHDVGGRIAHYRIPSSFLSAHAYGGTMLLSLPFLLDRLVGTSVRMMERWLATAGLIAAGGGVLMCGARSPMAVLAVSMTIAWMLNRFSLKLTLVGAVLLGIGITVAANDERLQRGASAANTEVLTARFAMSTNETFIEIVTNYPFGAGLGSAVGTSIPFFLADVAPDQVGAENEYGRIVVEQGWFGLAGWVVFLVWLYRFPPSVRPPTSWRLGPVFMYALTVSFWMTGLIGTGTLTSIPATFMLLTQMGILVRVRNDGRVPDPIGHHTHGPLRASCARFWSLALLLAHCATRGDVFWHSRRPDSL